VRSTQSRTNKFALLKFQKKYVTMKECAAQFWYGKEIKHAALSKEGKPDR
jgi:hypothetical protein